MSDDTADSLIEHLLGVPSTPQRPSATLTRVDREHLVDGEWYLVLLTKSNRPEECDYSTAMWDGDRQCFWPQSSYIAADGVNIVYDLPKVGK